MRIFKYGCLLVLIGIPLLAIRDFSIYYRSIHSFVLIVPGIQDERIEKPGVYHTSDWPEELRLLDRADERQRELFDTYTEWIKSNFRIQRARGAYFAIREPPEYVEYHVIQRGARWGIRFEIKKPGYYRFTYHPPKATPGSVKYLAVWREPDKGYWGTLEWLVQTPVGLVVFLVVACFYVGLLIIVARIGRDRKGHVEQETDPDWPDT